MFQAGRATFLAATLLAAACSAEKKDAPPPPPAPPSPAAPPPSGAGAPEGQAAEGAAITGELRLGDGIGAEAVRASDVIYLIARQSLSGQPGQLIATQRIAPVALPAKFTLAARDVMVPGTPFTGPFVLSARLDRDGDAMTKGDDDLYASAGGDVKPGDTGVSLVLGPKPAGAAPSPPSAVPAGHPSAPAGAPQHPPVPSKP